MNPKIFFGELKRRNVYKIAVAYAVVGWLLIQVATQVFPFLEITIGMFTCLRDDSPYKNLRAKVDLPTAS